MKTKDAAMLIRSIAKATKLYFAPRVALDELIARVEELEARVEALAQQLAALRKQEPQ